jgi:hypothetical protein
MKGACSLLMQPAAGSSSGVQPPPCINTALPLALLSHIFDKLDDDVRDLVRAAAVCKLWHERAREQDRCGRSRQLKAGLSAPDSSSSALWSMFCGGCTVS